jgi:hypothetical protein
MNRTCAACLAVSVLLPPAFALAGELDFFSPDKVVSNPHAALLRSPAINTLYLYSVESRRHYMEFDFGAKIPAVTYHGKGADVEFGGAGGIFTRFELFSQSFNFVHADFTGMLYTDVRYGQFLFETSVFHTSSHVGDDYVRYHHAAVVNTGYEAARQRVTCALPFVEISLGLEYKFSRRPDRGIFRLPSLLLGSRIDLLSEGVPLFIEWEAEIFAGRRPPGIGIRAGVYLRYLFNSVLPGRHGGGKEPHEFSIYYYNGYSKMGYFSERRETLVMAGPTYRY